MHLDYLISDLALITIAAGVVTLIFKKLKLPIVLGYIVAGFLISPNFTYLPTVVESADIHVWANIGVVFLMFGLGLEFSFKKLATVGGSAFIVALTVMGAMVLIGTGVGSLLGWGKMDCIFLGCMLSMSSTMIILKAYEEDGLKEKKFAQLILSTLIIEDIVGIFMMIILSTISVSQNVSGGAMFGEIGMMLMYLVIWLLLGIYLIPTLLKKASKLMNEEMMVIVSVAICLGMVVIANFIGFSEALGAFMAGSILAGTVPGRIYRAAHQADKGSVRSHILRLGRDDDRAGAAGGIRRSDTDNHDGDHIWTDDLRYHWDTPFRPISQYGYQRRVEHGADRRILFYHSDFGNESGSHQRLPVSGGRVCVGHHYLYDACVHQELGKGI